MTPYGEKVRRVWIEDVLWMIRTGETIQGIVRRLQFESERRLFDRVKIVSEEDYKNPKTKELALELKEKFDQLKDKDDHFPFKPGDLGKLARPRGRKEEINA